MTLVFFNLLANATFSLLAGLTIVGLGLWIFRVPTGPWKTALLSLPFAKIVFDFVRGLPVNSVLVAGIDPYTLPPKHQTLTIGGGFTDWGPQFNVIFSTTALNGKVYASSLGDYLASWINRKFGGEVPLVIVSIAVTVAATLIIIRLIQAIKFEKRRRHDRLTAKPLRQNKISARVVDVYVSKGFSGTPFTGGIIKPYICIPADAKEQLSSEELETVIGHELGHIAQFDLVVTIAVQFLGDFFWFVPGYRWLSKKIDHLREINADQWATGHGANPALLASALIKLREIPESSDRPVLYSAFFRRKSLLKSRIEKLIGQVSEKAPRLGWNQKIVRFSAFIFIAATVMLTTIGGNQSGQRLNNPDWFEHILKSLGLL